MSIYAGDFNNQSDLEHQFQCGSLDNCYIIFASYEIGDYCGNASVLFIENNRLYEINASHCSCYGLEGQWEPEETFFSTLQHRMLNGNLDNALDGYGQEVLDALIRLGFH